MPVPITVAQVPLFGHHVAHRAWFRRWQFLLVQSGFDIHEHLGFGSSRQYQLGFLDSAWKVGSNGRRVEAERSPHLGIPKIGSVSFGGPRSFHNPYEPFL